MSRPAPLLASLVTLYVLASHPGCQREMPKKCPRFEPRSRLTPTANDPVVADVNGRPVTASQVARRAAAEGLGSRDALDALISEELLVQEAERLGLARDPEVLRQAKQTAVYTLVRQGFEQEFTPTSVSDTELRKLYELNARTHFQRPELRRFSHIAARRPWQKQGRKWVLDASVDQKLRQSFEELRAEIAAGAPQTWQEFEAFATGERAKALGLFAERGTKARDELQMPFSLVLFALDAPGAISGLIATREFYHVAFLLEITPAKDISFEAAREEILNRYFPEAQQKAFGRLISEARARCAYQIWPEHLPVGTEADPN